MGVSLAAGIGVADSEVVFGGGCVAEVPRQADRESRSRISRISRRMIAEL
jgi:hypothetical protein